MVLHLDHIHVEVSDRDRSQKWFKEVMDLVPAPEFESWAKEPGGPLTLVSSEGEKCLALFEGEIRPASNDHTIAMKTSGTAFLEFAAKLDVVELHDRKGNRLTSKSVTDHDLSWSIYFVDLDGNRFEITTYDYDLVAQNLPV